MLSGKLVHLIEQHSNQILDRVLRQVHYDDTLPHMHALPALELREWGAHILENLGEWLTAAAHESALAHRYEELGRLRCEEEVPLHESVAALCALKEHILDFVQEQGVAKTAVQLYAEEELEHRIGRFFDLLTVHLVRGYEAQWKRAAAHAR